MTSNIKKRLGYSVNIFLMIILIFVCIPTGQAASANMTIENNVLAAGDSTNVTVTISNDVTQALSLKETIPQGWILTRGTDDADQFKVNTSEWVWLTTIANTTKTVNYEVTVPSNATPGIYSINGSITTSRNATDVTGVNTVEVKGTAIVPPTQETFGFNVTPLSATVGIGNIAAYNLTLTNTGNETDTYSLVANTPNNATVTLAQNNVTVGQGNSAVVELTVVGSTIGTYVVNVKATSQVDTNNSKMVTTTTNVVVPELSIKNLKSVPNSAISSSNPAEISADVTKGLFNIVQIEFGIIDSNNRLGKGADTVLIADKNTSGIEGSYSPENWPATYMTIGNVADVVSTNIGDASEFVTVRGIFKADAVSNRTDAVISFNRTTGNISNITDFSTGELLTIQSANSTFQARTTKFTNGNVVLGDLSTNIFILYDMAGHDAINNPSITVKTVPNGNYKVYAIVTDTNGSVYQLIDINTMPISTGGGSSGSSGGTYTTVTPTANGTTVPTVNVTTVSTLNNTPIPTVTIEQTTVGPTETTATTPIPAQTNKSPGIGIVAVIGIIGTIYIIRRRK